MTSAAAPQGSPPVAADGPVIGITAYGEPARWGVWDLPAVLLPRTYVDAVVRAGGVPVLLPPLPGLAAAVVDRLDGLLLSGGPDVDPARYGERPGPHTQEPRTERDASEVLALERALATGRPVLGVCRGMQLLNVVRGGSLVQHLPDLVGHEGHAPGPGRYGMHEVTVAPGSGLEQALGAGRSTVPSYHHQSLGRLGAGLVPTAWSADGTVEAVEDPSLPFCVAVQWHPEAGEDPALFDALVAAAREHAAARAHAAGGSPVEGGSQVGGGTGAVR